MLPSSSGSSSSGSSPTSRRCRPVNVQERLRQLKHDLNMAEACAPKVLPTQQDVQNTQPQQPPRPPSAAAGLCALCHEPTTTSLFMLPCGHSACRNCSEAPRRHCATCGDTEVPPQSFSPSAPLITHVTNSNSRSTQLSANTNVSRVAATSTATTSPKLPVRMLQVSTIQSLQAQTNKCAVLQAETVGLIETVARLDLEEKQQQKEADRVDVELTAARHQLQELQIRIATLEQRQRDGAACRESLSFQRAMAVERLSELNREYAEAQSQLAVNKTAAWNSGSGDSGSGLSLAEPLNGGRRSSTSSSAAGSRPDRNRSNDSVFRTGLWRQVDRDMQEMHTICRNGGARLLRDDDSDGVASVSPSRSPSMAAIRRASSSSISTAPQKAGTETVARRATSSSLEIKGAAPVEPVEYDVVTPATMTELAAAEPAEEPADALDALSALLVKDDLRATPAESPLPV